MNMNSSGLMNNSQKFKKKSNWTKKVSENMLENQENRGNEETAQSKIQDQGKKHKYITYLKYLKYLKYCFSTKEQKATNSHIFWLFTPKK